MCNDLFPTISIIQVQVRFTIYVPITVPVLNRGHVYTKRWDGGENNLRGFPNNHTKTYTKSFFEWSQIVKSKTMYINLTIEILMPCIHLEANLFLHR